MSYQVRHKKRSFIFNLSLTNKIIIFNCLVYFLAFLLIIWKGDQFFSDNLALTPSLILSLEKPWTLITSIFMHAGFFHLFANMFSLFFLGNFLERIVGKKRFFWLYLISGIVGGLFFIASGFLFGNLNSPAVGASGAIFGLLGVLAVLVPYSKIYLIIGPLIALIADVLARQFLTPSVYSVFGILINILIILMIFSMFSFNSKWRRIALPLELPMWILPIVAIVPLVLIGLFIDLPIGNSAHFGGLVVGLIYGVILRLKFPRKTEHLRKVFR